MLIVTDKTPQPRVTTRRFRWLATSAAVVALAVGLVNFERHQFKHLALRTIALSEHLPHSLRAKLSNLLASPLENRFPPTRQSDLGTLPGVVVLGGGNERLREAGRLARAWPHLKVFVSSAGAPAQVLKMIGPGIEPTRLTIETLSTTTFENAQNTSRMTNAKSGEPWLLVTSAVHMPRSVGAFRRVGMEITPWPVFDLKLRQQGTLSAAAREWLGLGYYWLMGRSSALFPSSLTSSANTTTAPTPQTPVSC